MKTELNALIEKANITTDSIHKAWAQEVQNIANRHQVHIATGHLSDMWQVSKDGENNWLHQIHDNHPALDELMELDNKVSPFGVGPSNMERFTPQSEYDQQAENFLTSNGIRFRATLSDTKTPAWEHNGRHGHHYRVTLSGGGEYIRPGRVDSTEPAGFVSRGKLTQKRRLTFDFWGSIADAEKGVTTVKPYDVLACISSDAYTPETFSDFCAEFGYEPDSIKALQTFRRCSAFAKRLRAFFTQAELEQLSEIH